MDSMTDIVATFGFEPPMRPGFIEPVVLYLCENFNKVTFFEDIKALIELLTL